MASDPEGQLSDQSDIPANSEVREVVINWGVSKDNLWRWCGVKITTRPSRCACRNIECTSIRVCLACVARRFCVVLSGARLSSEAAPVPASWPAPAFYYLARPTKTAMLRRLVRLLNWLILMPAVLLKMAYSAQNSARTPLFCSVSEKISAPRAVFIFANIEGNLGLTP